MKKYRILPLLLIVCLLLTAAFPAAAAKSTADASADAPQSTANVSSDGVPQSTVQAAEGSYVLGSAAVASALDEKLQANCVLLVDEDSATHVRWIFARFLEIGSCTELAREVGTRGIRTPRGNRIDKKYRRGWV